MVEENIKAIRQFIGKPLSDFNEGDIEKLATSDLREKLADIDTVEYLMENSNESIFELLTPSYVSLSYNETMNFIEKLLLVNQGKESLLEEAKAKLENAEGDKKLTEAFELAKTDAEKAREELKNQMISYMETDGIVEILAATLVLLSMFPGEYDIQQDVDKIKDALKQLESVAILIPLQDQAGVQLFVNLLDYLYFPLISNWKYQFNEMILEKQNPEFRAKLDEYSRLFKEAQADLEAKMAENKAE